MIMPSKIIAYEESLLSKLPFLLKTIGELQKSPYELYRAISTIKDNPFQELNQFLFALDTLIVLEKISYQNGVLKLC